MRVEGDKNTISNSGNRNSYSPKFKGGNSKNNDTIFIILGLIAAVIIGVLGFFLIFGFMISCIVDYFYAASVGVLWAICIIFTLIFFLRFQKKYGNFKQALKHHMIASVVIAIFLGVLILLYNGNNSIRYTGEKMISFWSGHSIESIEQQRGRGFEEDTNLFNETEISFDEGDPITLDRILTINSLSSDKRDIKIMKLGFNVQNGDFDFSIVRDSLKSSKFSRVGDYGKGSDLMQFWENNIFDYSTNSQKTFSSIREEIANRNTFKLVSDTDTLGCREIRYKYQNIFVTTGWFTNGAPHYFVSCIN